jgi:acyl-CoA synthetase (AMP-forming)/AMP-acid ligase II
VADGWWPRATLGHQLAEKLGSHGDVPFVIHSGSRSWRGTYGDVLDLSRRAATGLVDKGVRPGDVVSFQTPNWIEGVATFYGAALLGAVVAPVVHFYGSRELAYILGECAPRVHVTASRFGHQDFLANLASIRDCTAEIVVVDGPAPGGTSSFDDLVAGTPIDRPRAVNPADPALVGWTSGTTAKPKGVIHSHQTVWAETLQLGATTPPNSLPSLVANPISHAIGMLGALLVPISRGRPVHLLDVWDPTVVLQLMLGENLSASGGATYFLTSLLDHPALTDEHLDRMRYQGMGGSPVPRAVTQRADSMGINIYRMYGSTEHPSITGCTHLDPLAKRLETDGRPLPGCSIRLVDDDDHDVAVGEQGEILSQGPDCFLGYTDRALTASVFDGDGWYRTGDVGVRDSEGYVTITDRLSDVIIRGGENISAAEVEEVMLTVPGVAEVAVVAAPDSRMGERACAVIRMRPGATLPDLAQVQVCMQDAGLARQKWPEEVLEVGDFPRTPSGKIQKFVLRDRLREGERDPL